MKPDKLEQFVIENRDAFDDQIPSAGNWERIKGNIRPVRQVNWTARLVRVAAAVVIFVSTYIFVDYTVTRYSGENMQSANAMEDIYENIPMLAEARAYYSSQISSMENEVFRLAGDDSPIRNDIKVEFEELDKIFNELKTDLQDNADNQEVVEAMIQHYRIKLQILEEILIQLRNAEAQNTDDHENEKVLL